MDKTNHERRVINSLFYANSIALLLVLLAWYSLYQLRDELNAAISTARVKQIAATLERDVTQRDRESLRGVIDDGDLWMSTAGGLTLQTLGSTWTTEDQREYERLRAKLNPMLVTPDYRKLLRDLRETPIGLRNGDAKLHD